MLIGYMLLFMALGLVVYLGPAIGLLYLGFGRKVRMTMPRCAKCDYDLRTCWDKEMCPECEALLYASSRVQLLKEIVIPALTAGKIVLCDRYIDSSLSYQAYARGLGYDFVAKINDFAFKNCMPDITVFFDIDPCDAFLRKGGADKNDRLEQSGIEFHKKVYEGYKELAKKFPERIVSIGAAKGKEEIHREVLNILRNKGII